MFCKNCGTENDDNLKQCAKCGAKLEHGALESPPPQAGAAFAPQQPQSKGLLIATLLLWIFVAPVGFVLSIIGLTKGGKQMGCFLAMLITGVIGWFFMCIILAIAIPNLMMALSATQEKQVIGSLRVLASAQMSYRMQHNQYASDPDSLATDNHIGYELAQALSGGEMRGFNFYFTATPGGSDFSCYANPDSSTGKRSFFVNSSETIRWIANSDSSQYTSGGEDWKILNN